MTEPEKRTRVCPECKAEITVWPGEMYDYLPVPRHWPGGQENLNAPFCWVSRYTWAEAEAMVRLRQENQGALLRSAHP